VRTRLRAGFSAMRSPTGLRRVLNAYGLYAIVEFAIWLAILIDAYGHGGARLVGFVAVIQLVPAIILVPLLATFADRIARGSALVIAHVCVSLATLLTGILLLAAAPFGLVVAAAAVCTTAVALVRPIHFAALPQLAHRPDELVSANALSSVMDGVGLVVGPIFAGLLSQWVGPWLVFACASLVSCVSALMCTRLNTPTPIRVDHVEAPPTLRTAAAAFVVVSRNWALLALVIIVGAKFVVEGGLDVMSVTYSDAVLHSGGSDAGFIVGAVGLGGLIGAAVGSQTAMRRRLTPLVLAGGLLTGFAIAAVSLWGGLGAVMTLLAIAGFGATLLMVSSRTLLQRSTDDGVLARVFALQEASSLLGLAIGALIAPLLIVWTSPSDAFLPLGLGMVLLTVGVIGFVRSLDATATYRPVELALLRRIPFLSPLQPGELEYVANHSTWLEIHAGDTVVRQGERGTDYYAISSGTYSVTVNGVLKSHQLEPGQGFGELALLNGEIRTATITALTEGRLLVIRPQDFLGAFGRTVADLLPADIGDRDFD